GVVIALDRQERGKGELSAIQEVERDFNMPVVSIITLEQVLQYLDEKGDDNAQQHADAIRKYREQYGI
ncbi:MAG: orotate phosphoribosyltransferase, partial [Oceanospirillum sp.]|nr:orotate phosphoribosyltransferase [Oceanospirillum sp.]